MSWKHRANHPRQVRVGQFINRSALQIAPVYPKTPLYSGNIAPTPKLEEVRCYRFPMIETRLPEALRADLISELNAGLTEVKRSRNKWAYWADHFWHRHDQLATLGFDASALAEIKEVEMAIRAARWDAGSSWNLYVPGIVGQDIFKGSEGTIGPINAILARCIPLDTSAAPLTGPTPEPTPVRGPIFYQGAGRYIPPQGTIR